MKQKEITRKQYETIGRDACVNWVKPIAKFTLVEVAGGNYEIHAYLRWIPYLILFIPVHLIHALELMWDGGLKNFEFADRCIGRTYSSYGSTTWERANEIMKNRG